jgi:hypothetical protein
VETGPQQLVDGPFAKWQGQVTRRIQRSRPSELERMERVASGYVVELAERRSGKGHGEPVPEEQLGGAQAEWAELDTFDTTAFEETLEMDRRLRASASREEKTDRLIEQAADGKSQGLCGRAVHPLIVIDGDQHGASVGHRLEERGDRNTKRPAVEGSVRRIADQQRRFERPSSGLGQRGHEGWVDVAEQVTQDKVWQLALGLRGPGRQDAVGSVAPGAHRAFPKRRFADPRLPDEQGHPQPLARAPQEVIQEPYLAFAADELASHARIMGWVVHHVQRRCRLGRRVPIAYTPGRNVRSFQVVHDQAPEGRD